MKLIGMDVGSTTVKAVVVEDGRVTWQDYQRHNTRQAEKVFEFLERMEREGGIAAGRDRIFFTGSGAGFLAPLAGGKLVQEVVAVAACVEKLHPDVRFVSEIGGEDMKTIFFTATGAGPAGTDVAKSKQVFMQSACSGGTGTFVEKTARKLQVPSERLADMPYDGKSLHKVSSKCGIFAETDANTLVKTGVPVEEIIASLFEAVVYQNLATLTKGNTPMPEVLLLGGPNLFFAGLQQAWRHHLMKLWAERKIALPEGRDPASLILVPTEALYYACLGCVEVGRDEAETVGVYAGSDKLRWWIDEGQHEQKAKDGGKALVAGAADLVAFKSQWEAWRAPAAACGAGAEPSPQAAPVLIGCDFGSTTAKAVVLSPERELLFSCYALSKGNPIEDAQSLFRQVRAAGFTEVGGLALTGYGKDLLMDVLGADMGIVETVAHATAALHFFPDADVICDVGGTDVKIMILRQGTVADFRLNSQCSSGNGAFLQGVAERYNIPLEQYAEHAFEAKAMPALAMGCGVFLAVRHREPAAQGLVGGRDHGGAGRRPARQRVDLRGPAPEPARGGTEVHPAGRDASQHGRGQGPGGLHPRQGPRRRRGRPSVFGGGGRHRRGALRRRLAPGRRAQPVPRLRHRRGADVHEHDQPRDRLQVVPDQLHAHLHRRAASRRPRPRVEQDPAGPGLGARHQRQFLSQGPGRGRQRAARGQGQARGGQA